MNIGDLAFYSCISLETVTFGDNLLNIEMYAFQDCEKLKSADLPESLEGIGQSAFNSCASLEHIYIGDNVKSIGDAAFRGCSSLLSVSVGAGLKEGLSSGVFYDCASLSEITVSPENGFYASCDGVLFNKEMTRLIFCPPGKSGAYTIPGGVLSVENNAFRGCAKITGVLFPKSVKKIGSGAFSNCLALTEITLPDGLTAINDYTFLGCAALSGVNIPDSVAQIGQRAFEDTALYNDALNRENGVLYIQSFLICADKTAQGAVTVKKGTRLIADCAFSSCREITSVTLPGSVEIIGSSAFNTCSSLESVVLGENVKKIGEYAFFNCVSLNDALFRGTAQGWKRVATGDGNGALLNALRFAFKEWGVSVSGDILTVNETPLDGTLFAAFYDASGKMRGIKVILKGEGTQFPEETREIKLFVADENITPLCRIKVIAANGGSVYITDEKGNAWSPIF